jgi:hypothetical protein
VQVSFGPFATPAGVERIGSGLRNGQDIVSYLESLETARRCGNLSSFLMVFSSRARRILLRFYQLFSTIMVRRDSTDLEMMALSQVTGSGQGSMEHGATN